MRGKKVFRKTSRPERCKGD